MNILVLGNVTRPELRDAWPCLHELGNVAEFADAGRAAAALAEERFSPDVIVVAQAFPGEFSHEAIDRLQRLAPLARVVGLMGSWCEGEMRSGSPWPATARTYWHHWPVRGRRQFRGLAAARLCSLALPLTATEEEHLLADVADGHPEQEAMPTGGAVVAIRSRSVEMADWLSAACRKHGWTTNRQCDSLLEWPEGTVAGVFDLADLGDHEWECLGDSSRRCGRRR